MSRSRQSAGGSFAPFPGRDPFAGDRFDDPFFFPAGKKVLKSRKKVLTNRFAGVIVAKLPPMRGITKAPKTGAADSENLCTL